MAKAVLNEMRQRQRQRRQKQHHRSPGWMGWRGWIFVTVPLLATGWGMIHSSWIGPVSKYDAQNKSRNDIAFYPGDRREVHPHHHLPPKNDDDVNVNVDDRPFAPRRGRPFCLYAQNRGWGNSVFSVLTFLGQAMYVERRRWPPSLGMMPLGDDGGNHASSLPPSSTASRWVGTSAVADPNGDPNDGLIDLRTGEPCHPDAVHSDGNEFEHCVNRSFPCIVVDDEETSLGRVYTNLFLNMVACPSDKGSSSSYYNHTSCPTRTGKRKGVHELTIARTVLREYRSIMETSGNVVATDDNLRRRRRFHHHLPDVFQLNGSYVQYILEQSGSHITLHDLMTTDICVIQFRFGDYWFRESSNPKYLKDKRLCQTYDRMDDRHTPGTEMANQTSIHHASSLIPTRCFEDQANILLDEACPDPSIPVYLATDWSAFADYMCNKHSRQKGRQSDALEGQSPAIAAVDTSSTMRNRQFVSQCPSFTPPSHGNDDGPSRRPLASQQQHIHDVDLASSSGKAVLYPMLTDWIVLALAKTSSLRKHHFVDKKRQNDRNARTGNSNGTKKNFTILSYGSTFVETADLPWKVVVG